MVKMHLSKENFIPPKPPPPPKKKQQQKTKTQQTHKQTRGPEGPEVLT